MESDSDDNNNQSGPSLTIGMWRLKCTDNKLLIMFNKDGEWVIVKKYKAPK